MYRIGNATTEIGLQYVINGELETGIVLIVVISFVLIEEEVLVLRTSAGRRRVGFGHGPRRAQVRAEQFVRIGLVEVHSSEQETGRVRFCTWA